MFFINKMHVVHLASIDMNLLVVLGALLDTHSVREAANQLALSPSATSHALSRLRQLLDDELLVRAGSTLVPTPRAERMRAPLTRLLDAAQTVLSDDGSFDPSTLQRDFHIATTDYAELLVVRPLSDALACDAPAIDLHARPQGDMVQQLRAGTADLGLGVVLDPPADVRHTALFGEEFVCLLRRGHPALNKKLTLDRYAKLGHVLVAPRGTPVGVVDHALRRLGKKRRVARTVASFFVAPHLVANSDFVLTVARRVAHLLMQPLDLVMRTPPIGLTGFDLRMYWHRKNEDDDAHTWIRQRICALV